MNETKTTWKEIDNELEALCDEFAEGLLAISKKVAVLKEKMETTEAETQADAVAAIFCKGILKEMENICRIATGIKGGYREAQDEVSNRVKAIIRENWRNQK